ncbi:hypothetical protein G6O69_29125 [Pseudenhygromyxa sp. WMMC2535]|nr:hypothetical protein [Pseudenhygromyxa sp. WMMC2535]
MLKLKPTLTLTPALLAAFTLAACSEDETEDTPNRVLDRPTDVVLICADRVCETDEDDVETCEAVMQPLEVCDQETGSCTSDNPHLIGFVANSERNEVAMFTTCGNRLVDMSAEVPGYNFIPAGILPTELTASSNGCRVYSANVGSCDLSLLDGEGLSYYALQIDNPAIEQPSTLVSQLLPQRFDEEAGEWLAIGARPGEIVAVPSALTTATTFDTGTPLDSSCDPRSAGSVYVSFPTCNLVAEIDAQTGHVLQSRQFVSDGEGGVDVVDTGLSPICPVECPSQFEDGLPSGLPAVDADGPFPQALELLTPTDAPVDTEDTDYDEADAMVDSRSLFVGGLGSDTLFELRIAEDGVWESESNALTLTDAGGIKRIRVSPAVNVEFEESNFAQFLYVIAGDGSTRVVGRGLPVPDDELGTECETQLDPNAIPAGAKLACVPVSQVPAGTIPAERRGTARGPGIRASSGGEITDWMFRKTYGEEEGSAPFDEPGVVAVGVSTDAEAIYVVIDQEGFSDGTAQVTDFSGVPAGYDPSHVMDARLFPHAQWPDPSYDGPLALPSVADEDTTRLIPSDGGPTRDLAPSLRLIDGAYLDKTYADNLNVDTDFDLLASLELESSDGETGILYSEDVPKVVVHDYRSWFESSWTLAWEGTLVSTASTGRIACDEPGWEGGTCLMSEAGVSRLHDDSASFCDTGVLPGDKLVLIGCYDDDDCGDGRSCLRESAAGGESSGICISEQAYDERAAELRQVCADFIADPCGEAHREFTITRAFQDSLWLQSMDRRPMPYVSAVEGEDGLTISETVDRFVCADEQPGDGCDSDQECVDYLTEINDGVAPEEDWVCVDQRCRRPCENEDECVLRRLPGPACFAEFVRYQIDLRDAFLLSGPINYRDELVDVDPDTGECVATTDTQISRLLTSRIPLPATDDPEDPDWADFPICPSDTVEPSDPNPCRIDTARNASSPFHNLTYVGETVSAIRFSNPIFSLIIDLTSVDSLSAPVPGYEDYPWPVDFAGFQRARIGRDYQESFDIASGYRPFADIVTLGGYPMTYPVRIIPAPELDQAFIVDGSGPGTTSSIRGQVLQVELTGTVDAVEEFDGVR